MHEVQQLVVRLNMLDDESAQRAAHLEGLLKNSGEKIEPHFRDRSLEELRLIKEQLAKDFKDQKDLMSQALKARQTYAERLNSVSGQLGSAAAR